MKTERESTSPATESSFPSFPLSRGHLVTLLLVLVILYYSSLHSYLLFHSLVELFSILVFFGIFVIAWNVRHIIRNNYLLFLGIAYFFIGIIDLEHTLSYKGMGVLVHAAYADHSTKLWIGARYTEGMALLLAPLFLRRRIRVGPVFALFSLWTLFLLWAIHAGPFPVCFSEGSGLTPFKKGSEYVIAIMLAGGFMLLHRRRYLLDGKVYHLLAASIVFTIASELAFTFYVSVFGLSNLFGHFFKFISAYLIYLALIETGLKTPYQLLFHELREKAELLAAREQEFRGIFELSAAGMVKVDPASGRFILVNRQLCLITGYGMEELLARDVLEITHPEDREASREVFAKLIRQELTSYQIEKRFIRKDGEVVWVRISSNVIASEADERPYAIAIIEDITKRRRDRELLRESEERFRLIARNIKDVIWMSSPDLGRVIYVNPAYEEVWGRSCNSLYQRPLSFLEAVHPEDRPTLDKALQKHGCGKRDSLYRIVRPDGSIRWIEDSGSPIYNIEGDIVMMVGVARDITPRKRLEEQEKRRSEELEKEVSLRTAELAESVEKLRILALQMSDIENRERRRIAAYLHDDLQQLVAAADMHLGRLQTMIDHTLHDRVAVIEDILEETKKASRSLSHDLSPPILYNSSLRAVFEWLAARKENIYGLRVHLAMPDDLDLESDILRVFLYRSVKELLFNVVKHAASDEASLTVATRGNDTLAVEVADPGRGIDPEKLKDTDVSSSDVGFGIFSIRERLQLLGGTLSMEGSPGEGSRFIIHLPLSGATDVPPPPGSSSHDLSHLALTRPAGLQPAPCRDAGQIRVVIADDHEIFRHGLVALLGEEQDLAIVGQAVNGAEAVRLVEKYRPDVVIMDMEMPDMGGIEAAGQISGRWPEVAVIAHSMYEHQDLLEAAEHTGIKAFCAKCGSTSQLLAAIRQYGWYRISGN